MSQSIEKSGSLCGICSEKEPIYTCPRCNLHYCSLVCYKSCAHSQCSEIFYEECVKEELASTGNDEESKKAMAAILTKMRHDLDNGNGLLDDDNSDSNEDSDDYNDDDLSLRLANIDLDNSEDIWNNLTDREKRDFSEMLATADIIELLPPWTPWWTENGTDIPELAQDIPAFTSLTKCQPSLQMPALTMNTLSAYQLIARCLRGEVHGMCVETVTIILNMSSPLRGDTESCKACKTRINCNQLLEDEINLRTWPKELNITYKESEVRRDQELLCSVENGVMLALSDLLTIFREAAFALKDAKKVNRCTGEPPSRSTILKAEQKLRFYLSWSATASPVVWETFLKPVAEVFDKA